MSNPVKILCLHRVGSRKRCTERITGPCMFAVDVDDQTEHRLKQMFARYAIAVEEGIDEDTNLQANTHSDLDVEVDTTSSRERGGSVRCRGGVLVA
jgi:hypothetical protein